MVFLLTLLFTSLANSPHTHFLSLRSKAPIVPFSQNEKHDYSVEEAFNRYTTVDENKSGSRCETLRDGGHMLAKAASMVLVTLQLQYLQREVDD